MDDPNAGRILRPDGDVLENIAVVRCQIARQAAAAQQKSGGEQEAMRPLHPTEGGAGCVDDHKECRETLARGDAS